MFLNFAGLRTLVSYKPVSYIKKSVGILGVMTLNKNNSINEDKIMHRKFFEIINQTFSSFYEEFFSLYFYLLALRKDYAF